MAQPPVPLAGPARRRSRRNARAGPRPGGRGARRPRRAPGAPACARPRPPPVDPGVATAPGLHLHEDDQRAARGRSGRSPRRRRERCARRCDNLGAADARRRAPRPRRRAPGAARSMGSPRDRGPTTIAFWRLGRAMADAGVEPVVGVLGGSGVYELEELSGARWEKVESPFGAPSDDLLIGEIAGATLVFLPRHGRGHRIPPSEINYRANIDALKRVGVTDLISVSRLRLAARGPAPGHLRPGRPVRRPHLRPRRELLRARAASRTSRWPTPCATPRRDALEEAAREAGRPSCAAAPTSRWRGRSSPSRAESELYRFWGCDVIGMTNMPEAKLAREAEICYASIAMVTDYDCWHDDHADVEVADIVAVLTSNADRGRALVVEVARRSPSDPRPAPRAATGRSTPRSSPRPRRATPRSCGGSTPWRGGFSAQPSSQLKGEGHVHQVPDPNDSRLPQAGRSSSATSRPCWRTRRGSASPSRASRSPSGATASTRWPASRPADSSSAWRWRSSSRPASFRSASRASCPGRPSAATTSSSTGPIGSRSTPTRSRPASGC